MRMRKQGKKGKVEKNIEDLGKYKRKDEWKWENMEMKRERKINGDEDFIDRIKVDIEEVIEMKRDVRKIEGDVREMREMIEKEKKKRDDWELKMKKGGIIDIEFIEKFEKIEGYVKKKKSKFEKEEVMEKIDKLFEENEMVDGIVEENRL